MSRTKVMSNGLLLIATLGFLAAASHGKFGSLFYRELCISLTYFVIL